MRNPRSIAINYYAAPPKIQLKRSIDAIRSEAPGLVSGSPQVFEIMSNDDDFVSFLKFVKFSPAEIARTVKFVSVIGKIAATGNWIYGGYKTTVAILTFLGIIEREEPQELQLLMKLAEKIEAMYKHMEINAAKAPFIQAAGWRVKLSSTANAIRNAATSRSQDNIDDLRSAKKELQEVILLMLDPALGEITFNRQSQGYFPEQDKEHWVRAAAPHLMMRAKGPLTDNYAAAGNLGQPIWDPGFYLDILFDALALRLSAAAIIEPLHRSTGYDRHDLLEIYKGLGTFISNWESAFLQSNLDGAIEPVDQWQYRVDLGLSGADLSPVLGRRMWSADGWPSAYITLGAADPVTGVSSIDFQYAKNFSVVECRAFQMSGKYPALTNYDAISVQLFNDRLKALRSVTAASSIGKLKEVRERLDTILSSPAGGASEVVDVSDPRIDPFSLQAEPAPEQISLGSLDKFATVPGKTYIAVRYHGATTKRFRVTLGRRMDVSGIQLGYRMEVSVGGDGNSLNLPFVEYSSQESTKEVLSPFPTVPILGERIQTNTAKVYDAIQSGLFSAADEDAFESFGEIDGKQRLFLNERTGPVSVEADVRFSMETPEPGPSFVGFADVELRAPDKWPNSHAFVVTCRIFEKRWVVDPVFTDKATELQEVPVETIRIHFCPSFLTVDAQFFIDYWEAWWKRESATLRALQSYKKDFQMLWEEFRQPEPIEFHRRLVIRQQHIERLLEAMEHEDPRVLAESLGRADLPEIRHVDR